MIHSRNCGIVRRGVHSEAAIVKRIVGVLSFSVDSVVIANVPHAVIRITTMAAIRIFIAVNALLLRKFDGFPRLDEVITFNSSHGRESPAGATLALVLNRLHRSKFNPVDRFRKVINGEVTPLIRFGHGFLTFFRDTEEVRFLLCSPVGELVVSNATRYISFRVERLDESLGLSEKVEAECVLISGFVALTVLGKVLNVSVLNVDSRVYCSRCGKILEHIFKFNSKSIYFMIEY